MIYCVLDIELFVSFNDIMKRKTRIQHIRKRKEKHSPTEDLRTLASLIAQFHIKKVDVGKKPDTQSADTGEMDNGQNLS